MKKYTHAWLAYKAIKRLRYAQRDTRLSDENRRCARKLVNWFRNYNDEVTQGAWYPDAVIHDMTDGHVLKITPANKSENTFKNLPKTHRSYYHGSKSPLLNKPFHVNKHDNLPDRCESIAQSVVDHLKMQETEDKGSPVAPTGNQIGLLFFMLSHYLADAHMPFHCDGRKLGRLHNYVEKQWDDDIKYYYQIDESNEDFFLSKIGQPLRNGKVDEEYKKSFLKKVEDRMRKRKFLIGWGDGNNHVWDFASAICQYSYLLSHCFIPKKCDYKNLSGKECLSLGSLSFDEFSVTVFSDAIDSIARVWLRAWRRYTRWKRKQSA